MFYFRNLSISSSVFCHHRYYVYKSSLYDNDSPIHQEIIALLRSKGGKSNCFDENGREVGEGNGDLNR